MVGQFDLASAVLDCIRNHGAGDKVQSTNDSINVGLAVYVDYTLGNVIVNDNNTLIEMIKYCTSTYMGNNTFVTHFGDFSELEGITLLGYNDALSQEDWSGVEWRAIGGSFICVGHRMRNAGKLKLNERKS